MKLATRFPAFAMLLALALGAVTTAAPAQTLVLKDGSSVTATRLRREGQMLMNTVSAGEVGYPVANVARLDFPEPPPLAAANEALAVGKPDQALRDVDPVVAAFTPMRDIPGNWWPPAAMLKASALIALGRDNEAKGLLTQLAESPLDKNIATLARLRLTAAFPVPAGQETAALQACDAVLRGGADTPRELGAEAWLLKGKLLLARKEFRPALLAYLHLPTLYYDQRHLQAPALLGSARAYLGMKDEERARRAFQDVVAEHAAAPEAAAAKIELRTLDGPKKTLSAKGKG